MVINRSNAKGTWPCGSIADRRNRNRVSGSIQEVRPAVCTTVTKGDRICSRKTIRVSNCFRKLVSPSNEVLASLLVVTTRLGVSATLIELVVMVVWAPPEPTFPLSLIVIVSETPRDLS